MPRRVLVVDDDADFRESLVDLLLAHGGGAVEAVAGVAEARARFRPGAYALVLIDLRLPDGNGVELVREFRRRDPRVCLVLMTAYGEREDFAAAEEAGADRSLRKPFDLVADFLEPYGAFCPHRRVLVADDDPDFLAGVADDLRQRGLEVVTVADGLTALARARTESFDALVLDLRLPGLRGDEILRALAEGGRSLPTIVVTGYAAEEAAVLAGLPSTVPQLTKPIGAGALAGTLRDLFQRLDEP
ncbi:MAG: response regulator [Planctomycetota bacterium]|nr:MAG: response regulator [Planctomycetota bacterium]